jgi:hypothetical protein
MKLIFELFLIFNLFYLYQQSFVNSGEIPKDKCTTISYTPLADKAFYIRTSEFPKDNTLYFKMTMNYGYFKRTYIYYGAYNSNPSEVDLTRTLARDTYSRTSWLSGSYITETYYYYTSKPNEAYLFVAPPPAYFYYSTTSSYISVCSTDKYGISIGVWIGIGIAVVVIIAVVIVFYCCRRARRMREINTAVVEPIALNAPAVVAPATVVAPSPSPYMPNPTYY